MILTIYMITEKIFFNILQFISTMTYYSKYLFSFLLLIMIGCSNNKDQFDASGNFETDEVIVSAEANGKIMKLALEEGERLHAGQKIGYIDTVPIYLQKEQLKAEVEATLAKQPAIRPQLQVIQEQLIKAEVEQKRTANLLAQSAARKKDLDDWNAQVELLKKQYNAELSTLNTTVKSIITQTHPINFQIKLLEDQLRKCIITNPIEGIVLTKYAMEDEMTMAGKPLYRIANLDTLTLRAYITGDQLPAVKLGQRVKVFVDKGTNQYTQLTGIVRWISDKSEFTPKTIQTKDERANLVYAIKIKVKNDGSLKIGMYGEVKFE
jgi:HlyD family secretion protein